MWAPPPERDLHAYAAQAGEVARFSSCLRTGPRGLRGVVQAPCSRFKASRRRSGRGALARRPGDDVRATQRPDRGGARGSRGAAGGGDYLVSRGLHARTSRQFDRKSVVWGKSVSVRVERGGRGSIKK